MPRKGKYSKRNMTKPEESTGLANLGSGLKNAPRDIAMGAVAEYKASPAYTLPFIGSRDVGWGLAADAFALLGHKVDRSAEHQATSQLAATERKRGMKNVAGTPRWAAAKRRAGK